MASIISSGIGSGLDIAGIVQQLVAAEGQPLESRIVLQESRAQAKLSAFGSLKGSLSALRDKLSDLKTPDKFLARTAISSNEDAFTVSAGTNALPANYDIEIAQLAQSQKLTSGAFTSADAVVGTGSLTIATGGAAMILDISEENNTLAGIRDSINDSLANPGVSASIVNADSGSYLIITAESTGAANGITITQADGDGGLSALEYDPLNSLMSMTESIAAQDALIRIDGLDVMSASNTISGAIQGVTITALASAVGVSEQLSVANDDDSAKALVSDFVDAYNNIVSTIDSLTAYDPEAQAGSALVGDATIRGIQDQLRRELSVAVKDIDAPFSLLSDIGVEIQLDGKLSINSEKLDVIVADDFVKLGQLFSNSDGFATRLYDIADGFLSSDGILESRTQGLTANIEGYSDDRLALTERLASLETRLLRQFNALDSLLAELSSTSNFLSQQLSNLPGAGFSRS